VIPDRTAKNKHLKPKAFTMPVLRPNHRRLPAVGITLLEVMIAIFVMSLGVLSVAAGILSGASQAARGNIADRAAACGRAALNEFRVRGMARPDLWYSNNTATAPINTANTLPLIIDPFAFKTSTTPTAFGGIIKRYQLAPNVFTPSATQGDFSFMSPDDLVMETKDDGETRPLQLFTAASRLALGDYTWSATITAREGDDGRLTPQRWVNLAIAVYHKRSRDVNTTMPVEVMTTVSVTGGYGGVTVTGTAATPIEMQLAPGRWVVLIGQPLGTLPTGGKPSLRCKWYRISGADVTSDGQFRSASLTGPDWDTTNIKNAVMIIPDGVVAVFEKPIQLEGPSLWSTQ